MPLDTDEAISSTVAQPREGKKRPPTEGWGNKMQGGGSRTYSRYTTSSCFIHRFKQIRSVLFVACFLLVTDNVVVLLLSELSGLYLPVQGCLNNLDVAKSLLSSTIFFISLVLTKDLEDFFLLVLVSLLGCFR